MMVFSCNSTKMYIVSDNIKIYINKGENGDITKKSCFCNEEVKKVFFDIHIDSAYKYTFKIYPYKIHKKCQGLYYYSSSEENGELPVRSGARYIGGKPYFLLLKTKDDIVFFPSNKEDSEKILIKYDEFLKNIFNEIDYNKIREIILEGEIRL